MAAIKVKICGIKDAKTAFHATSEGADFLGFIHFARSPRHLELDSMAQLMADVRAQGVEIPLVSVVVDPDDATLDALRDRVRPDLIQLHGHETPERVAEIAERTGTGLIKVISVSEASDLAGAAAYAPHIHYLMFDAKTPRDAALPGGLGLSFDWSLMRIYGGEAPWFLAGGLTPGNIAEALNISGAMMADVSSGVESAPGIKDIGLISGFLRAAKGL